MNSENLFSPWRPYMLSILRIMTALLYLEHGTMKLFGFPGAHPVPLFSLFGLAGVIEVVGSLLLIAGLFTRPVAFVLAGEMAVAYFMVAAPHSFFPLINHGDEMILFCFIYLYVATAGAGPWSLDHWRAARRADAAPAKAHAGARA
jgi:putative oxidoreductase